MSEKGFEPLTSQLGITGTSFRLQLGLINEKWAARILKGKDIMDSYVFKDEDCTEDGAPNQNIIVGYCLRTLTLPNINPYGIMKTTQALVKQALDNKEKRKVMAPIAETKDIELEKVPEDELRRPKVQGWVKEDAPESLRVEEEKRAAFQASLKAKKAAASEAEKIEASEPSTTSATSEVKTVKTSRSLPSIPSAGASVSKSPEVKEAPVVTETSDSKEPTAKVERDLFCPFCGKDLAWKFCPYCGKPLPHSH